MDVARLPCFAREFAAVRRGFWNRHPALSKRPIIPDRPAFGCLIRLPFARYHSPRKARAPASSRLSGGLQEGIDGALAGVVGWPAFARRLEVGGFPSAKADRAQGCARVFRQYMDVLSKDPDDLQLPAQRAPSLPATPPPRQEHLPRDDYLLSASHHNSDTLPQRRRIAQADVAAVDFDDARGRQARQYTRDGF
jgi:hypothetical protein